ncbi:MAG: ornithine carbamoyltransferase [Candidatus Altiarchaeota archaeon]
MAKHLLSIAEFTKDEILHLLDSCADVKENPGKYHDALKNKTLIMLFEKPSTRTRISFEAGMTRLGGHAIYFDPSGSQLSRGESLGDTAATLSGYADAVMARVFKHDALVELARHSRIPVINGLSDVEHPCQILADLFTMKECGKLDGRIAYVGDGNNVCNSMALAAEILGLEFVISCPHEYEPSLGSPKIVRNPAEAVKGADVVYTDVWISMGNEAEEEAREREFMPYQVNGKLVAGAKKDYVFMHCLPAHRGYEVTDEVIDSKNSVVFQQAENRMHMQNAILLKLIE